MEAAGERLIAEVMRAFAAAAGQQLEGARSRPALDFDTVNNAIWLKLPRATEVWRPAHRAPIIARQFLMQIKTTCKAL